MYVIRCTCSCICMHVKFVPCMQCQSVYCMHLCFKKDEGHVDGLFYLFIYLFIYLFTYLLVCLFIYYFIYVTFLLVMLVCTASGDEKKRRA